MDYEESSGSNKHAEQLAAMANRMLSHIDYRRDLRGVGVAGGPGSYTARRMEVYTAIYTGSYGADYSGVVVPQTDIAAVVLTDEDSQLRIREIVGDKLLYYFGNGAEKAKALFDELLPGSHLIYDLHPRADAMLSRVIESIERGETEDVAYWEPYYLKEYEAKKSVNKVLSRLMHHD